MNSVIFVCIAVNICEVEGVEFVTTNVDKVSEFITNYQRGVIDKFGDDKYFEAVEIWYNEEQIGVIVPNNSNSCWIAAEEPAEFPTLFTNLSYSIREFINKRINNK